MKNSNIFRSAVAILIGSLTMVAPASAVTPQARPAIQSQIAVTPVEFSIGFSVNSGNGYYNGYRGYRSHRHGYRLYNGFWFPNSAFVIGRSYEPRVYHRRHFVRLSGVHVRWCHNRYRSYRAYDNSYQPYNGPRRACYSPYF